MTDFQNMTDDEFDAYITANRDENPSEKAEEEKRVAAGKWQDWLGPAYDEMPAEHIVEFVSHAQDIEARYPEDDSESDQNWALFTTLLAILGETTLAEQRVNLAKENFGARQALISAAAAASVEMERSGMSEVKAAQALGLSRSPLRRHLGKNK